MPIISSMASLFEGIRVVLFDLDGTLIETNIDFKQMRREILALGERYGIPACQLEGLDILAMLDTISTIVHERYGEGKSSKARREGLAILEKIELSHSARAECIPGAQELVRALREAGIKVGIVTRNSKSAVAVSLSKTGITGDILLTRDDVPKTKPHPSHLLTALQVFETAPQEAMIVGDHWMDVQAGKAADMRTVGFLRKGHPSDFFSSQQPDFVIRDLRELIEQVRRLKM